MPTIKGVTILKAGEIPETVKAAAENIKLPFSAKSFSCSNKNMEGRKFRDADNVQMIMTGGKLLVAAAKTV